MYNLCILIINVTVCTSIIYRQILYIDSIKNDTLEYGQKVITLTIINNDEIHNGINFT